MSVLIHLIQSNKCSSLFNIFLLFLFFQYQVKRSKQDDTESVASYSLSPVSKKRYCAQKYNDINYSWVHLLSATWCSCSLFCGWATVTVNLYFFLDNKMNIYLSIYWHIIILYVLLLSYSQRLLRSPRKVSGINGYLYNKFKMTTVVD